MEPSVSGLEGNTNSSKPSRSSLAKKWCFTWNNYPEDALDILVKAVGGTNGTCKFVFGKEIAPTTKTPHIQGYIECDSRVRPIEKFKLPKAIHWEVAKGSDLDNYKYCTKENNSIDNFPYSWKVKNQVKKLRIITQLYEWQEIIVKEFRKHQHTPNDRTIYWIYDETGGKGKTAFCKYLVSQLDFGFLTNAKSADISYYCSTNMKEGYCFNLSRSLETNLNYQAIESCKDGLMFSSKYESSSFIMDSPFIVIFANFPPNITMLSIDRWMVMNIEETPYNWKTYEYENE